METILSSMQNPRIKQLLQLQQKSSERRKHGMFVVEGRRELQHCIEAGYVVDTLFTCPELLTGASYTAPHGYEVTPSVYEKIA